MMCHLSIQFFSATCAHEIGHAILDDGSHVATYNPDADYGGANNLMCKGGERAGTHLAYAQCTKARAHASLVDVLLEEADAGKAFPKAKHAVKSIKQKFLSSRK